MTYLQRGTCYRGDCQGLPARRFINEWLCSEHAGETYTPDPARTINGLRAAAGRLDQGAPLSLKGGSDILKERPGGYVSRQRAERIGNGTAERQHR